jgi:hypothetical protein
MEMPFSTRRRQLMPNDNHTHERYIIMEEKRAMTPKRGRELGLLTEYAYMPPIGQWEGKLIAKCWGNGMNIICFFEDVSTGEKYQLSAWRHQENVYRPKDDGIDFSQTGMEGQIFLIETKVSSKGKPVWLSAIQVD